MICLFPRSSWRGGSACPGLPPAPSQGPSSELVLLLRGAGWRQHRQTLLSLSFVKQGTKKALLRLV